MAGAGRSDCPLSLSLELIGDRWTLLILRDMIFSDRRHFRDLLQNSDEGIASNVLASRLQTLVDADIVIKRPDSGHRQKIVYSLTDRGVELLPLMIQLGAWGSRNTTSKSARALWFQIAEAEGPGLWRQLMDELRIRHSGTAPADSATEPAFAGIAGMFVDALAERKRAPSSVSLHER